MASEVAPKKDGSGGETSMHQKVALCITIVSQAGLLCGGSNLAHKTNVVLSLAH